MKVKRKASNGRIAVSKHYFLDEFCHGEKPNPFQVKNIFALAAKLEVIGKEKGYMPVVSNCLVTPLRQSLLHMGYDAQLANAEAVEFWFDVEGVDPRHTSDRITL
ncbi:hypothetical protein D9M72_92330 [compost metagenome]